MQIQQGSEFTILIPENWQEDFKLSFKAKSIHCNVCGLEGCKPYKHGIETDPFAIGDDELFPQEISLQEELCQ